MKNKNFWFGKRVLVTGADGFVAAHLIKKLIDNDAVVIATVRHKRSLKTLDLLREGKVANQPDMEYCDLLDYEEIRRVCDRHQIDTIFHLAATAIVSDAANAPMSTIENNVMGTLNVLEVARINNIPRVLIASSDKSYGDHTTDKYEKLPYKENYALRGLDVYSSSKVCSDMIAQTYAFQFKLPVMICRSSNIYGPGDMNFTRLIPRTIMRLMSDKPPVINTGNENVLREYIYVEDVVDAYMLMAEQAETYYGADHKNIPRDGVDTYGWPAFNVGSYTKKDLIDINKCSSIKSVNSLIKILREKVRDIEPNIIPKPSNFIEIPDQYIDASKLFDLGFKPKVSFEEGIEKTTAWYKKNFSKLEPLAAKYLE
ncbi:GDP-mannose 4,6-dehydratase [Candidatus Kaiserbacteria bacterium]|nr:MAG: GDP-mannose 4,6-dehydratase [Candidatus Kaiserbacteria bacterium]